MPTPFRADRYQNVSDAWARVEREFQSQKCTGQWDEDVTDTLMTDAHRQFDAVLTIVPQSLAELQSYVGMLRARDIKENAEAIEVSMATIDQALTQLIAEQRAPMSAEHIRDLEFALWSLSFALYEEKNGNSHHWTTRIQEALKRGFSLVHHRGEEFRRLIDETPGAPSLFKKQKSPASGS